MRKKIIVICLFLLLFLFVGYELYCHLNPSIAVLGYHDIYDEKVDGDSKNQFVIEKGVFENQMKYLSEHHYKTLSLDEFYCWKKGECDFGKRSVVITFDDGYYSNYKYAFEILKKYDLKATVFFIGAFTPLHEDLGNNPYMSFDTIEKCKTEYPNIEFASHSFNMHGEKNVTNMTREEIKEDIKNFSTISDTKFIAYPEGHYNDVFIDVLKDNGYKMAFGFGPEHKKANRNSDDFVIPRLNISANMPLWKYKLRINMPF